MVQMQYTDWPDHGKVAYAFMCGGVCLHVRWRMPSCVGGVWMVQMKFRLKKFVGIYVICNSRLFY